MSARDHPFEISTRVDEIAADAFECLSRRFPVCLSSDEFHYFPQAVASDGDRFKWDDFSPDSVRDMALRLSTWEGQLRQLATDAGTAADQNDIAMTGRLFATLREQLTEVRSHETQPTFYLTIVAIGLADAIAAGPALWRSRIRSLPRFLDAAQGHLRQVPGLYRELGRDMASRIKSWLAYLKPQHPGTEPALEALERLRRHLDHLSPAETFLHPPDLYERIACTHIGCRMPLAEIERSLEKEITETRGLLQHEAARIAPGKSWQQALQAIPRPVPPQGGVPALYRTTIRQLADHCSSQGWVAEDLLQTCPVRVKPIPDHLVPIRSAAAYSMPPGHPPRGGTFFTMKPADFTQVPRDIRLLTAHETYPGHHLLDTARWKHPRRLRRHIEFPLFYEGWASFSEELLFDTGFFQTAAERMLLAKRRFWRAVRGLTDLQLHTGRRDLASAAEFLSTTGLPPERALAMVKRYALKPGYQLSYTIGRRGFRRLYDRFSACGGRPHEFVRRVLSEAEIGVEALERSLLPKG